MTQKHRSIRSFAAILGFHALISSGAGAAVIGQLGILQDTANGGINPATGLAWAPGDTYRLVFITSTTTAITSTDITFYNDFVQGLANAAGLGGGTWNVVGSTATVDARDNTSTNPTTDGTGEPIVRMDGEFVVAIDFADLWDGIDDSHEAGQNYLSVHLSESGVEILDERVRTGSDGDGMASTDAGRVLGNSSGDARVTTGRNFAPNAYGNLGDSLWMRDWSEPAANSGRLYAMSDPLTVVPEPSSMALLGLAGLALWRRRR